MVPHLPARGSSFAGLGIALVTCLALLLNSCAPSYMPDAEFAGRMNAGDITTAAIHMHPAQSRMPIRGDDGKMRYPIEYTIYKGDSRATFHMIRNGSPTRLRGESLSYCASAYNQPQLARELASAGYGTHSEIAQAQADLHRHKEKASNGSNPWPWIIGGLGALYVLDKMFSPSDRPDDSGSERDSTPTCRSCPNPVYNYGDYCSSCQAAHYMQ